MSIKKKPVSTDQKALALHKRLKGKISIHSKIHKLTPALLSQVYTPGVASIATLIAKKPSLANELTMKGNSVAVISDGSAVLGLGNIGPLGALPVMEGKALLFKTLADIDAVPIVLTTIHPDETIAAIRAIAPTFGAINLEDIKAPECFYIEKALSENLPIPVMHDDQHGTAIVVLAGLINSFKVAGRIIDRATIVINGVGAAGQAIARILRAYNARVKIIAVDSVGVVKASRADLSPDKVALISEGILHSPSANTLAEALVMADVFVGVSRGNILTAPMIQSMNTKPIIFALANPTPEIHPNIAKEAGAYIVATGRNDFPNQVNNALVFPGVFRGLLDSGKTEMTMQRKLKAGNALAKVVATPTATNILPTLFNPRVVKAISKAVAGSR
jgi:malate dehydrogenase (oxaloacetate-decarboxylating)